MALKGVEDYLTWEGVYPNVGRSDKVVLNMITFDQVDVLLFL